VILETLVTTLGPDGTLNLAPMGPTVPDDNPRDFQRFELRPWNTSQTWRNLERRPEGVLHVTDDAGLFIDAIVGSPIPPMRPAESIEGMILAEHGVAREFRVVERRELGERIRLECEVVKRHVGRPFIGFHRARHALIEAAIVASRIGILPDDEILGELARLEIPVGKTAGPSERDAFDRLRRHVMTRLGRAG
jgi:hypothetical protein